MYGWLSDACDDSSHVVTASRRLARELKARYNQQQLAAGRSAWRTPTILAYPDWLNRVTVAAIRDDQPTRINAQQSRVLWERVLGSAINDPLVNITSLARQARDAWKRIHEWGVPFDEILSSASGADQRLFAKAAIRYRSLLELENWVDDALLVAYVIDRVRDGQLRLPSRVAVAGFDRTTPQVEELFAALKEQGTRVEQMDAKVTGNVRLLAFENSDAELLAAGAWARAQLNENAGQHIAIIVSDLEQNAGRDGRLIREGLVPGWQYATGQQEAAANVSFGRRLSDYPAIRIALLLLRWSCHELSGRDVSLLLRTPFVGNAEIAGRARLELELRQSPDRQWSPAVLSRALQGREDSEDAADWLARMSRFAEFRESIPKNASPARLAELIDTILREFNWPGNSALDSADFQLVNRWRELLNDLARLELVSPGMTMPQALAHIATMTAETVFQPEMEGVAIQVLGPLEAAGLTFDQLWITGLTTNQWPPAGRPMALVSRRLQRHYGMPDADPRDTAAYASRVLGRLLGSSTTCLCSYPLTEDDADQTPTSLLGSVAGEAISDDPGWHAAALCSTATARIINDDPVPPVSVDETVAGGAGTIQRQLSEPFAAFAYGRLGITQLRPITAGLSPILRGNLIHGAMFHLYEDTPAQSDIRNWDATEMERRIESAVQRAFARYERNSDRVLGELLALERQRVAMLLGNVIQVDRERESFSVDAVEASVDFSLRGVRLKLRIDRIDRFDDGAIAILDYKTGASKKFLDSAGDPVDVQLAVYACALPNPVAALALYNIDSRAVALNGAGRDSMNVAEWEESLSRWAEQVERAAVELAAGDVRVRFWHNVRDARALNLLSRYGELHSDA